MRALSLVLPLLVACGGSEAPKPAEPAAPVEAAPAAIDHSQHGADAAAAAFEAAPTGSSVSFGEPADGATVTSPVKVVMNATGVTIQPAGELKSGTGHHHLVIDGQPVSEGEVVPKDATHIHFGDGKTETSVELTPGSHTLTLQVADGLHRSYGPALATTITVNVEAGAAQAGQ